MVYVISKYGKPLMPTKRHGWVRRALKEGKASVVQRSPFTIKLKYGAEKNIQPVTLGIDAGYKTVGFSAVTKKEELIGGEFELLKGLSERLKKRAMYRKQRRSRLRHRKPGFLKDTKNNGWLAPSIDHKLNSHIGFIEKIKIFLPVKDTIIEVASFDIQKIKNVKIEGKEYQEGEQYGFKNVREYVLHRDSHKCQNPDCKRKSKILQVHHIGFWKKDRSDRTDNLITICLDCHVASNHQKDGFLYGWQPKIKSFREATFMTMVRWKMVNQLQCQHTYGHITKSDRIKQKLEKSHHNDAFVIAGGNGQSRCKPYGIIQRRRNNRSLEKFYDAKYIDLRDGKKKSGKDLCSQRRKRSRENLPESLRQYRAHKTSKGRRAIRKQRYPFQPGDLVMLEGKILTVKGTKSKGTSVLFTNGKTKIPRKLKHLCYGKGITFKKFKSETPYLRFKKLGFTTRRRNA